MPLAPLSPRPTRLVICGFGAFPGVSDNPAQAVVERLRSRAWTPEGAVADYLVLPTVWEGSAEMIWEATRSDPADAVLVLGVAGGADGFRVEQGARNCAAADRADARGALWPEPRISERGPDAAGSAAPVEAMAAALRRQGLPASVSADAGDYLCNFVFYRLLTEVASPEGRLVAAFLHLPDLRQPGALALDDVERGVRVAASVLVESVATRANAD
jgi:pyroglutamyl-peptidase